MRTRRSPRNQEILWRALGGKQQEVCELSREERINNLRRNIRECWNARTRRMLERDLAKMEREAALPSAEVGK